MEQVNGKTAKEISLSLLAKTEKALLSNDFDSFVGCFHLPHSIGSAERRITLETRDDMRSIFDRVVEDYRSRRITALVRIIVECAFNSETQFTSSYVTHMMAGDLRVADPFPCYSIVDLIDGHWLITFSEYDVDKNITVGRALHHKFGQDD